MRLALATTNPTVGDIPGNEAQILAALDAARQARADLVVLPELAVCGYPPKDLLHQEGFVLACVEAAKRLGEKATHGLAAVFGVPLPVDRDRPEGPVANSLVVYREGQLVAWYDKRLLPTYDVFDEDRYFTPGRQPVVFEHAGHRVGLAICEDLWKGEDAGFSSRYADAPDPVAELVEAGATLIVAPSASPFVLGKDERHRRIVREHARRHGVVVASLNQLGGNDELVFDGHAMALAPDGTTLADRPLFRPDALLVDLRTPRPPRRAPMGDEQQLYSALVLGVRDYLRKTGFRSAIIGLSGGIDSALTAVVAAAALGPSNVLGVAMPGPYSSEHALADARALASNLGLDLLTLPILQGFDACSKELNEALRSRALRPLGEQLPDVTEENLQSRLRGTMLMALSNRTGAIVLTTGNKSELAVGYCTLYGDMNGGLAVLSDVSKQWVYRLSRWINDHHASLDFPSPPIPEGSLTKPPSAELRPNQTDQDSLPPYDVLDEIIRRAVEQREGAPTIARQTGFEPALVARVLRLIDLAEYKRRQAALGLKVTSIAFGFGRRMPIAQGWNRAQPSP